MRKASILVRLPGDCSRIGKYSPAAGHLRDGRSGHTNNPIEDRALKRSRQIGAVGFNPPTTLGISRRATLSLPGSRVRAKMLRRTPSVAASFPRAASTPRVAFFQDRPALLSVVPGLGRALTAQSTGLGAGGDRRLLRRFDVN